jgi:hypothetical protein
MVPLLLPGASTEWPSIAAWCGCGAAPRGQQWPPAGTLPRVRDRATRAVQGAVVSVWQVLPGTPSAPPFLRNALPDLTTIVPVTAYYRINYVRDTVGL